MGTTYLSNCGLARAAIELPAMKTKERRVNGGVPRRGLLERAAHGLVPSCQPSSSLSDADSTISPSIQAQPHSLLRFSTLPPQTNSQHLESRLYNPHHVLIEHQVRQSVLSRPTLSAAPRVRLSPSCPRPKVRQRHSYASGLPPHDTRVSSAPLSSFPFTTRDHYCRLQQRPSIVEAVIAS
jgi:hypothetical protein